MNACAQTSNNRENYKHTKIKCKTKQTSKNWLFYIIAVADGSKKKKRFDFNKTKITMPILWIYFPHYRFLFLTRL